MRGIKVDIEPPEISVLHRTYDKIQAAAIANKRKNTVRIPQATLDALIADNKRPKGPDEKQMAINHPWITEILAKLDKKAV